MPSSFTILSSRCRWLHLGEHEGEEIQEQGDGEDPGPGPGHGPQGALQEAAEEEGCGRRTHPEEEAAETWR